MFLQKPVLTTATQCNIPEDALLQVRYFSVFRAVYKEADVYLLDDPLSAVDTHVGRQLFDDCICGFLQGKTRVLVTHQLQYLQKANDIIILSNVCLSPCITNKQTNSVALSPQANYTN
jgi:ABC-type transport system involved in cytochrome bd biosynthesis fused ATPase/permease subunit